MARRKDAEGQQNFGFDKNMVLSRDISGNKQAKRLIELYKTAEKDIAQKLMAMNGSTANARLMATQKKAIDGILKALRKRGTTIAQAMVEASYRGGFRSGRDELINAGVADASVRARMGSIHTSAMEVYSSQVLSRLSDVNTTAGRTVQDIYDQLRLNTVLSGTLAGTEAIGSVQRKMERLAESGGITAFVDKSGRSWSMATYTEMLARTTTMQVFNKAKEIEFREHDQDLIQVSFHLPTCSMCEPWNGAILSLSGKTEGYHSLQEAENDGLFHPNCRHTFSLYIGDGDGNSRLGSSDYENSVGYELPPDGNDEIDVSFKTGTQRELYGLLTGIDDDLRRRYVAAAFKDAPNGIVDVLKKYAGLLKYEVDTNSVESGYENSTIYITEDRIRSLGAWNDKNFGLLRTIRHEVGHFIDDMQNGFSYGNNDFSKYVVSASNGLFVNRTQRDQRLLAEALNILDESSPFYYKSTVSDIFDNLSQGNYQGSGGHYQSYYIGRPTIARKELFANLVELYAGNDIISLWYLEELIPDILSAFKEHFYL